MSTTSIDIMIPTFNEAGTVADAIANARQLGNVFVLDCHSTDGTQDIAREAGAIVVEHKFENFSRQKNWGLDHLPFTGEWILILDADERITPALLEELKRVAETEKTVVGFYVNRINVMFGKLIRHGGFYPSWNMRFFKRGSARYEDRSVHEHMTCDGPTGYLKHRLLHIRSESIHRFIIKHIAYADMESDEWIRLKYGGTDLSSAKELFGNPTLRFRQWLRRAVWPRLPGKPMFRFFYMYLFRFGFLDGRAGWRLGWLMANYEYMISLLEKDKLRAQAEAEQSPYQAPSKTEQPAKVDAE